MHSRFAIVFFRHVARGQLLQQKRANPRLNVAAVEFRQMRNDDPFVLFGEIAAAAGQRQVDEHGRRT